MIEEVTGEEEPTSNTNTETTSSTSTSMSNTEGNNTSTETNNEVNEDSSTFTNNVDASTSNNDSEASSSTSIIIGAVCGFIGFFVLIAFLVSRQRKNKTNNTEKEAIQFENETYGNIDLDQVLKKTNNEETYLQPVPQSFKPNTKTEDYANPVEEDNSVYSTVESSSFENPTYDTSNGENIEEKNTIYDMGSNELVEDQPIYDMGDNQNLEITNEAPNMETHEYLRIHPIYVEAKEKHN